MCESFNQQKVVVNDLLCFIQNNVKTLGFAAVRRLCGETYLHDEIIESYTVLKQVTQPASHQILTEDSFDLASSSKEEILKKILLLFDQTDKVTSLQFASSGQNLPRMAVYRDALSVACLWDEVRDLKQIIIEQNRLLSGEIHALYNEIRNLKQQNVKGDPLERTGQCISIDQLENKDLHQNQHKDAFLQSSVASSSSLDIHPNSRQQDLMELGKTSCTSITGFTATDINTTKSTPGLSAHRRGIRKPLRRSGTELHQKRSRVVNRVNNLSSGLFSTQYIMNDVNRNKHNCNICGYSGTLSEVIRHKRSHVLQRSFHCPVCPRRFNLQDNLSKHLLRKHGTYLAKTPSLTDVEDSDLLKTFEESNPEAEQVHESSDILSFPQTNPFNTSSAVVDDAEYSGALNVKEEISLDHTTNLHYPSADVFSSNAQPMTVTVGQPSLNHLCLLAKVKKRHSCDVCDYSSDALTDLTRHKRTHTGERPFACPICGVRFTLRGNMVKHLARKHDLRPAK